MVKTREKTRVNKPEKSELRPIDTKYYTLAPTRSQMYIKQYALFASRYDLFFKDLSTVKNLDKVLTSAILTAVDAIFDDFPIDDKTVEEKVSLSIFRDKPNLGKPIYLPRDQFDEYEILSYIHRIFQSIDTAALDILTHLQLLRLDIPKEGAITILCVFGLD